MMDSRKWLTRCQDSMSAWCITENERRCFFSHIVFRAGKDINTSPGWHTSVLSSSSWSKKKVQRRRWWRVGYQISKRFEKEGESSGQQTRSRRLVKKRLRSPSKNEKFQHWRRHDVKLSVPPLSLSSITVRGVCLSYRNILYCETCVSEKKWYNYSVGAANTDKVYI